MSEYDEKLKAAKARVEAIRGFWVHLFTYLLVNLFLVSHDQSPRLGRFDLADAPGVTPRLRLRLRDDRFRKCLRFTLIAAQVPHVVDGRAQECFRYVGRRNPQHPVTEDPGPFQIQNQSLEHGRQFAVGQFERHGFPFANPSVPQRRAIQSNIAFRDGATMNVEVHQNIVVNQVLA